MQKTDDGAFRLETDRYLLRPLERADVTGRVVRWLHDEDLLRFVELPPRPTVQDFHRFMRRFDNQSSFLLGIFEKADGRLIGFYQVLVDHALRRASTEVLIGDRSHWGTGAVFETRARILDHLFGPVGLHRVFATVHARNLPTLFNYKALGFTCEGILRDHAMSSDGEHADVYLFGLLQSEWRKHRASAPTPSG